FKMHESWWGAGAHTRTIAPPPVEDFALEEDDRLTQPIQANIVGQLIKRVAIVEREYGCQGVILISRDGWSFTARTPCWVGSVCRVRIAVSLLFSRCTRLCFLVRWSGLFKL